MVSLNATVADGLRYAYNVFVRAEDSDAAVNAAFDKLESQGCLDVEGIQVGEVAADARIDAEDPLASAIADAEAGEVGVVRYTTPINLPH